MYVDRGIAFGTLDRWLAEGRLRHRRILLLGAEVADVFFDWLGTRPNDAADYFTNDDQCRTPGLQVARLPHPGRILRLRNRSVAKWRKALGQTECRFRTIADAFAEGEAILLAEALRVQAQLLEADARESKILDVLEQNLLSDFEDEEIAREIFLEVRRERRADQWHDDSLDRLEDHITRDWWYGNS
jgi:hypothetical protein